MNRIDKDTTGLVLAARSPMRRSWRENVQKLYYAIVGELPRARRDRRAHQPQGDASRWRATRRAVNQYTILKVQNGLSLAACVPVTGHTHPGAFASIGHPLAGDDLYGGHRDPIGAGTALRKQTFGVPEYSEVPDGTLHPPSERRYSPR